jgi:putative aldouronate transport system permease protein
MSEGRTVQNGGSNGADVPRLRTASGSGLGRVFSELRKNRALYLLMVPGVLLLVAFNYFPLAGLVVAFKNFNYSDGIFRSPWAGLENFKFFLGSSSWIRVVRNTIVLNFSFIVVHTFAQVAFALLLNELRIGWYKKTCQSLSFLPYFISWIVVSVFAYNLLNYEFGALNTLLKAYGAKPVDVFGNPSIWPPLLVAIDTWKWFGYGAVIYLAVLAGINPEYYDAATMDGAGRWQQVRFVSLPMLVPTVSILTLLSVGRILNSDFGMFYGIIGDNSVLFSTTDVIDTFVYRALRRLGDFGMASAVSLLQSIGGFLLVLVSNLVARRYAEGGALF